MKKYLFVFSLMAFQLNAQDLTQNYRKIILNSPNDVSLFQSNSTNGIWASGMIATDRWGVFEDATTSKERLTVLSGGNVGIGTVSPTAKLDVNGEIVSRSNYLTISPSANDAVIRRGTTGNLMLCSNSGTSSVYLNYAYGSGSGGVRIYDGGTTNYGHLKVNSNGSLSLFSRSGDIGIGTTDTKGFKLGVNGKIAATEVKVATYANWADFVFKSDYDLPTLKEVEQHIKENGYLKDIPSAEEVKKDGFYLGEMDAKLLQKIEELTLYTIEQEKEIEILKKENDALKSLVERVEKLEEKIKS